MRLTPTQALARLQPEGKKKAKEAKAIELINTIGVAEVITPGKPPPP